jgi:two-component system, LytTR family, sensor histidine kinase AlgZ
LDWHAQQIINSPGGSRTGENYFFPDLYRGEGLLGLIVIALSLAVFISVAKYGLVDFNWPYLGRVSLLALGMALFSAMILTLCEQFLRSSHPVKSALLSYALVMTVVSISAITAQQALTFALASPGVMWVAVPEIIVTAAIPAGILLRYLFMQQNLNVRRRAEREARIQEQQARIKPHFLFNSMNTIASLIASNPAQAERAVEDLSDLYRRVLTESRVLIPLHEELSLCRRYLALEKLRLGDRLEVEWQIGDYGDNVKIPCLTLQPVLENAVYHGIQLIQAGGKIEIKIKRKRDRISIQVHNPRNPRIQHNKGSKLAIANVQHRLQSHFGPSAIVKSESKEDKFTTHIEYQLHR